MSSATKSKLLSGPNRIASKEEIATGENKGSTNVRSSAVTTDADAEKDISANINAVVEALTFSSPAPDRGGDVRFPDNGSDSNVSASVTGATAVTQIFGHNGDPI